MKNLGFVIQSDIISFGVVIIIRITLHFCQYQSDDIITAH